MIAVSMFLVSSVSSLLLPRVLASKAVKQSTSTAARATSSSSEYSLADQPARFAKAKAENNERMLNIDKFFNPSYLKGKTVLVTGANRGIGLALVQELLKHNAQVIATVRDEKSLTLPGLSAVIGGIDVTDDNCGSILVSKLGGRKIDILINNAVSNIRHFIDSLLMASCSYLLPILIIKQGYFYEKVETIQSLNFKEEWKMIDICALGPLRITSALFNAGLLPKHAKVAMITSQGGSVSWRFTQNPKGGDYGHHMSKAAANMMGVLLAQELKEEGIVVTMLHPGFNKTDMTKKYEAIWEIEGAVDVAVGAKRVLHEIGNLDMSKSGQFINCEDGLQIPY